MPPRERNERGRIGESRVKTGRLFVVNYEPWVSASASYVLERAKQVIESFGVRDPGSEGERRAQESVHEELAQYVDEARIEPFTVAPKAFMGFLPITCLLLLGTVLLYRAVPWCAAACAWLGLLTAVLEFGRYRLFLDPFFPKRTSHNVYGVRKASQGAQRRIILCGHIDAAYEMRYNLMSRGALLGVVLSGLASTAFLLFLSSAQALGGEWLQAHAGAVWQWAERLRFATIPVCLLMSFFTRFSVVSPGANDNLTGVFTALSVLKRLHETGVRFEHTEVACLSSGSEEAGLRGAKAFVARHHAELTGIETVFVALDTFRDAEHLAVYARDLNGSVKHHPGVCRLLQEAGKDCGVALRYESVFLGSSDATAFTQAGIPAAALGGMDPSPPRYYHTRLDRWDNMDAECVQRAIAVAMRAVERYDAHGL